MMIQVEKIWQQRSQHFIGKSIYYWRLIGSSGLGLTIVILALVTLIYYQDFLEWIPEFFPVPLAMALFLAFVLTGSAHRTLLKEADLLFLTPVEAKMETYFSKAFTYNLLMQCSSVLLILAIISPIYANKVATSQEQLWFFFIIPILLKGWNLHSSWINQRSQNRLHVKLHACFRFLFHFSFLYWYFILGPLYWLLGLAAAVILFYFYDRSVKQNNGYHWLHLIEMERRLESRFYRFANMFVDLPHLQSRVSKRNWLAGSTKWLPFESKQAYLYLYIKSFVRTNDYLWIYIRLTIIGAILVVTLPDRFLQAGASLLFLFLTSIQLKPLWTHHLRQFWIKIFPLPLGQLKSSFLQLHLILSLLQGVLMIVPSILIQGLNTVVLLIIPLFYAFLYTHVLLKGRLILPR